MRILALDTATRATAVAVCEFTPGATRPVGGAAAIRYAAAPERTVQARDDPPPGSRPRHTTRLLALVEEALGESGWDGVERIAVGVGPGTFTGLRIGIASAQALARARGIPLLGVSTLAALAHGHQGPVLAVIDARRGEAFAAAWDGAGALAAEPAALAPPALEALAASLDAPLAVGDGAVNFREVLQRAGARVPLDGDPVHRVTAVAHCELAAGPLPDPLGPVRPHYVREPDAKPPAPRPAP